MEFDLHIIANIFFIWLVKSYTTTNEIALIGSGPSLASLAWFSGMLNT